MNKTIPVQWMSLFVYCLEELHKYDVNVDLCDSKKVREGPGDSWTRGYWDDYDKKDLILRCATKMDHIIWLPTFAHEYCHFTQWRDRCKPWYAHRRISTAEWEDILHNRPIKKKRMIKVIKSVRDIELDCEKRTVKLFKKFKMSEKFINNYIRNANVYIFYQTYIMEYRKWYRKSGVPTPYENPKLLNAVSDTFYKDYSVIPYDLLAVFREEYPPVAKSNVI